jgi:hypothetical protein
VNEGEVAADDDAYIVLANVGQRRLFGDLRQEAGAVHQRAVGVAVEEIVGEVGVEPGDVGLLNGTDVIVVEIVEQVEIRRAVAGRCCGCHG